MKLKLLKGSWFRMIYRGTKKNERFLEVTNANHVQENVRFADKDMTEIELTGKHIRIGRGTDNHVILDDESASRNQCELVKHFVGGWFLKTLKTANPTMLKASLILSTKEKIPVILKENGDFKLKEGDEIIIGNTVLSVE
jgi:pSer/pThr/pTyr-binding forkhead associated (FHA) protein